MAKATTDSVVAVHGQALGQLRLTNRTVVAAAGSDLGAATSKTSGDIVLVRRLSTAVLTSE